MNSSQIKKYDQKDSEFIEFLEICNLGKVFLFGLCYIIVVKQKDILRKISLTFSRKFGMMSAYLKGNEGVQ